MRTAAENLALGANPPRTSAASAQVGWADELLTDCVAPPTLPGSVSTTQ